MDNKVNSALEFNRVVSKVKPSRGLLFGLLILGALLAFEIFNYSTTDFALTDLMGDLRFAGIRWAAILAIAFCGIDFAGIARLFTPEKGSGEQHEVWYLFGAWMLAATMNAMLTYWGVAIAIVNHASLGSSVLSQSTILKVVPVFVAVMVWVIRVLIIGSFSVAGDRLFSQSESPRQASRQALKSSQPQPHTNPTVLPAQASAYKPAPRVDPLAARPTPNRPEPTYHPMSLSNSNPGQPQLRK
ncbi:MAG: hypothetical protein C3F13_19295 [Anaerolineales bacterium]|nr:hypothetical protein [Anaerolineae bacterium]PWB49544.1 MAG: hypothetical protein C3F13_19295 [Anaerolineales bacterium]